MSSRLSPPVVIHAGAYKTATSTIQIILSQARQHLLSKQGLLYPRAGLRKNTGSADSHSRAHHPIIHAVLKGDADGLSRLGARLDGEIAVGDAKRVVLSSELISFAPLDAKQALADFAAGPSGRRVSVVYSVRRVDDYMESMLNQSLKNGRIGRLSPKPPAFAADIADWQRILGAEHVRVLWFSKAGYANYLRKALQACGCDPDDPALDLIAHDNPAMTHLGYVLRRIVFDHLKEHQIMPQREDRHRIGKELEKLERELGLATPRMVMMSSQQRLAALEVATQDMDRIAETLDVEDRRAMAADLSIVPELGQFADNPDAPLSLTPEALGQIIMGMRRGFIGKLMSG